MIKFNENIELVLLVTSFIAPLLSVIYMKIRWKLPVGVNCWFCNTNSQVPYTERNSFTCSSCKQYNGFTKDGGYNKVIPEQHDEFLNHIVNPNKPSKNNRENGLCIFCNNNQRLKIYQLAQFVPMNEENYDLEIEHFEKQLEKAYKLCPQCSITAKKTISKQNQILMGHKIAQMKRSGISLINNQVHKRGICTIFVGTLLIVLQIVFCALMIFNTTALIENIYANEVIIRYAIFLTLFVFSVYILTKLSYKLLKKPKKKQEIMNYEAFESLHNSTANESDIEELPKHNVKTEKPHKLNTSDKSDLSFTLENLDLSSPKNQRKKPLISPPKFKNPWTGAPWDTDVLSRCSSQSSGVYSHFNSRANSVCDDHESVFSINSRMKKFNDERLSNYLSDASSRAGFTRWSSNLHNNTFCSNFNTSFGTNSISGFDEKWNRYDRLPKNDFQMEKLTI